MRAGTESLLSCTVEQHRNATVVRVAGEIDRFTEDDLAHAVGQAISAKPPRLIVDLQGVTFMGTSGLSVLVDAHDTTQRIPLDFRVITGSGMPRRTSEVSGPDRVLSVFSTLPEALTWP